MSRVRDATLDLGQHFSLYAIGVQSPFLWIATSSSRVVYSHAPTQELHSLFSRLAIQVKRVAGSRFLVTEQACRCMAQKRRTKCATSVDLRFVYPVHDELSRQYTSLLDN